MKSNVTDFLRKSQFPLIIALGLLPVTLILFYLWGREILYLAWVFPGLYALLSILSLLIRGKLRLWVGIAETAAIVALGGVTMYQTGIQLPLLTALGFGGLLLYSLTFAGWEWYRELPPVFYWTGIILHALIQVFLMVVRYLGSKVLEPAVPVLNVSFFLLAALVVLALNRGAMSEAAQRRQKASSSMRWKNLILTGGFFVAALAISAVPSLWTVILRLWTLLKNFLETFRMETGPAEMESFPEETGPEYPTDETELYEPDENAVFLQDLFMRLIKILFVPVMVICGLVVLFLLGRVLAKVIRRLMVAIARYANATSSDYEDEVTSILDTDGRPTLARRLRQISLVDERKMTPTERIRFRYKRLMKKHTYWGAGSTARENLPAQAATLYEQARYTEKPVTEADAQAFIEEIKQVK